MAGLFRRRDPSAPDSPGWRVCRHVEDVMTSPVLALHEGESVRVAAATMDRARVLHLPVVDEGDRLLGIVTYRSVLHVLACGARADLDVAEVMRRDPVCVGPRTACLRALELMRTGHLGCLPVVGDEGNLVGIVTERDFIHASARLLDDWLRR